MPAAAVATYLRGEAAEKNDQLRWFMWFSRFVSHTRQRYEDGLTADASQGAQRSCPSRGGNQAGTRCLREVTRPRPDGDISVTFRTALVITGRIQNCISRPGRQVAA